MINHSDMAREMARLIDGGSSPFEAVAEMHRMFPTATSADCLRAMRISLERMEGMPSAEMLFPKPDKSKKLNMPDIAPVSTAIAAMMRAGTPPDQLVAALARTFPDLTWRYLSQALQVAQAQAERKALRPH